MFPAFVACIWCALGAVLRSSVLRREWLALAPCAYAIEGCLVFVVGRDAFDIPPQSVCRELLEVENHSGNDGST